MSPVPSSSPKPRKSGPAPKKTRFHFSVDRDIFLLNTTLNINPWQLGEDKWDDISTAILGKYGKNLSRRTLKDRIKTLVEKYKKEELMTKTGTEEEQTNRSKLVNEVIQIQEAESNPIILEHGAEDESLENDPLPSKSVMQKEKVDADKEREKVLNKEYLDTPAGPKSTRVKRTKAAMEDEIIIEKCRHDMHMEEKRFRLEESVKLAEIDREEKRLDLELRREKRLEEENKQRSDMFEMIKQSMECMKSFIGKTGQ